MSRLWRAALGLLVALVAFVWLATEFVAAPWVVQGPSMEPSFRAGDHVLVDVWTYRIRAPRPGEVLLVRGAGAGSMIKRVAASPDEANAGIWLVGDNSERSFDSRDFGSIGRDRVRGRVVRRLWPLFRSLAPPRGSPPSKK